MIMSKNTPHHTISKHHKHHHLLLGIVIGALLLLVTSIGAYFYISSQKKPVNPESVKRLNDAIKGTVDESEKATITSGFGFAVPYDAKRFSAYAVVSNTAETQPGVASGESFDKLEELKVKRNYTIVQLSPRNDSTSVQTRLAAPGLTVTTNFRKNYITNLRDSYKDTQMSDLEMVAKEQEKRAVENKTSRIESSTKITINGKDFYKIVVDDSYTSLDVKINRWEYKYVTVNDGSPYYFSISPIYESTKTQASEYDAIIAATVFTKHDDNTVVRSGATLASTRDDEKLGDLSNDEGYVSDKDKINIILRNQIATVRIGTIRCADVSLRGKQGGTMTIKDACNAGIGSGSIVSSDGLILTNGHVVRVKNADLLSQRIYTLKDDELTKLASIVAEEGKITAQAFIAAYRKAVQGDADQYEAVSTKLSTIESSVSSDETIFSIQTSNTPMAISLPSSGRWSWQKRDGNILNGKLIDYELNEETSVTGLDPTSTKSDVALIKMAGQFPTVKLSNLNSIESGDTITALGFPAIVDGGIMTKKQYTIPTASQGSVKQKGSVGGGHTIMATNVPIAPGNSGGPAFNEEGEQVGINTYSAMQCSENEKGKCFGNGLARDAADGTAMIQKNNLTIRQGGELTELWNDAIDDYSSGDIEQAKKSINTLSKKYPNNYLVSKMAEIVGSPISTQPSLSNHASSANNRTTVIIILTASILIFAIVAISATVVLIIVGKRHKARLQMAGGTPVAAGYPYKPQSYTQPITPPQQPYQYPQPNYPQSPQPQQYAPPQPQVTHEPAQHSPDNYPSQ